MDQNLAVATVLALPNRARTEDWRSVASCRGTDPNLFYPIGRGRHADQQMEEAKAVCRECPSQEACLAFAVSTRQHRGVWGATSPEERRRLARGKVRSVAS
jgi:WhiB family redox-sensing transcriptional regulator